jgi:methylglutaconyl-CoA hydratase
MAMEYRNLKAHRKGEVLELRLFRPQVRNAFNPDLIRELRAAFAAAAGDTGLRLIVVRGEGGTFCSGGDLNWMRDSLAFTPDENLRDAEELYALFEAIDTCRLPVVGVIEGFALGGGVGLVGVCDYALALKGTQFSLSEVRVGLVPACIGPFLLRKIGPSHARALFLSSERFDADRALAIGLVHEVAADTAALEASLARLAGSILSASPQALSVAKEFLRSLGRLPHDAQGPLAVKTLADIRVTPQAQEGLRAFLDKRKPDWGKAGR